MPVARMITNSKNITVPFFIEKTDPRQFSITDENMPTLIVGKKTAEELYGKQNVKILDRRITYNTSWTYSRTEKRIECEKDIENFINNITNKLMNRITYIFISPSTSDFSTLKRLVKFVKYDNITNKIFLLTPKHLYMYVQDSFKTVGVSLRELNMIGVKTNKLLNLIKSNRRNQLITNWKFIPYDMRKYTDERIYIIPYLYQLFKETEEKQDQIAVVTRRN